MDVVSKYFNFKKKCLTEYALLLGTFQESEKARNYIQEYIQTFLNEHYYHILDTYYKVPVTDFNRQVLIQEMEGKRIELLDTAKEHKEEIPLINRCYQVSVLTLALDLNDFSSCKSLADYKSFIRKIYPNLKSLTEEIIDQMVSLMIDYHRKEKDFLKSLQTNDFQILLTPYMEDSSRIKVELKCTINELNSHYTQTIIQRNYNSEKICLDKLNVLIHLLGAKFLEKIINHEEFLTYYIELPLNGIQEIDNLNKILTSFSHPIIAKHIVFVMEYHEYLQKQNLINVAMEELGNRNFALAVDFSKEENVEQCLAEIATFSLFKEMIVYGVNKEFSTMIENYAVAGKEVFLGELNK